MALTIVSDNTRSTLKRDDVVVVKGTTGYLKVIGISFSRTRFYGSCVTAQGVLINTLADRIIYGLALADVVATSNIAAMPAQLTE